MDVLDKAKKAVREEEYERLKAQVAELEYANASLQEAERKARAEAESARQALVEAEARYQALGESIPFGVWTANPSGEATYFSNSFLELVGMTLEDCLQFGWASRLPPEQVERSLAAWMYCVEHNSFWDYEYRILGTDDHYHTILSRGVPVRDASGQVSSWVGINLDITDRKRIEEMQRLLSEASSLLASSLDYETTLTHLAHFLVPTLADWCIIDMVGEDEQLCRIEVASDPAKEELLHELQRRYPPNWTSRHPVSQVLRTGEPLIASTVPEPLLAEHTQDAEHLEMVRRLNLRSGIIVPLIARGHTLGAISFASEKPGRYSSSDLTLFEELARRTALAVDNARLYRIAQEAVRTQKELDDLKDIFMAIATHELRNPLTALKGYAQMLQRSLLKQREVSSGQKAFTVSLEQSLSSVDKLLQLIERMNDLISQLLDFSRLQNKQLELYLTHGVNLVHVVRRIVEQQRATTKSQPVILHTSEETILASCDEARLEQVLVNLISNAIKYSNPGSPVIVGIERQVTENGHAEAVIRVQDEGQGISEEHQAHIFDRFYRIRTQANAKVDGMGLGLYISQRIVTEHGGRMWLKSKLGAGTTFYFSLPLTQAYPTLSH